MSSITNKPGFGKGSKSIRVYYLVVKHNTVKGRTSCTVSGILRLRYDAQHGKKSHVSSHEPPCWRWE